MYESKAYFYGTGRRKHSVSRVRLYPGTGKVTINDRDIDEYFGLDTLKLIVRQPFLKLPTLLVNLTLSAPFAAAAFPVRLVRSVTVSPVLCCRTAMKCAHCSKKQVC